MTIKFSCYIRFSGITGCIFIFNELEYRIVKYFTGRVFCLHLAVIIYCDHVHMFRLKILGVGVDFARDSIVF